MKAEFKGAFVPNGETAGAELGAWLNALLGFGCAWFTDELVTVPNELEFISAEPGAFPKGAMEAVTEPLMPNGFDALAWEDGWVPPCPDVLPKELDDTGTVVELPTPKGFDELD